ncbi:MAG: hypothetical protein GTO24_21045 [candidate division Zixibacteria bacterium]|nr:hypothetical protein [candidate division Zixibacteria bacterium]
MTKFLPEATDFTDMEVKDRDHAFGTDDLILCPLCHGHGGWNLKLNAYGEGRHFRSNCRQCNGWGWVKPEDAECIHVFKELGVEECRERGIAHWGMCFHVYECVNCDRITSADSSG